MLQPKRTKFRKQQKNVSNRSIATKGHYVAFGEYGLKSLDNYRITARQIEATRIVISKCLKRGGKIWIRIFPDKPVSKKPIEVRQGKGKGDVDHWVATVYPGTILFEISGISKDIAMTAFKLAAYKLPIKTIFISKQM